MVRLWLASVALGAASACGGGSASSRCDGNSDCDAGYACVGGACAKLCRSSLECPQGETCQGPVCKAGSSLAPQLMGVDGDGIANCTGGSHCVDTGLRAYGSNLSGALFTLQKVGGSTVSLTPALGGSDTEALLPLPANVEVGSHVLTAANQAGANQTTFDFIQGPPGPDKTPNELLDSINLATNTLSVQRLPVGTASGQVAAGDHAHTQYLSTAGGTITGDLTVTGGATTSTATVTGAASLGSAAISGNATINGNLGIGVAPTVRLQVAGEIVSEGLYKVGDAAATTYAQSLRRYVVDAPPSLVGQVVAIDYNVMSALCRDFDGCDVIIVMMNWFGDGNIASRQERLFLSTTSNRWRFANNDVEAVDANSGTNEWTAWDCYLTDAETRVSSSNGRSDNALGWGLLNVVGGSYSDSTTVCRVVIED